MKSRRLRMPARRALFRPGKFRVEMRPDAGSLTGRHRLPKGALNEEVLQRSLRE